MSRTRLLIADDNQLFRRGIAGLLEREADFEIAGEASDGLEVVRLAQTLLPDVVLMDVNLPELDGIAATRQILAENPSVKIFALSFLDEDECVMGMIRAGAKGYVLKDAPFEEVVLAIRTVANGSSYFSQEISAKLFAHLGKRDASPAKKMTVTEREMEVLRYIAEELTNKEIGAKLFISPRTVETHRRNLIQKLKVKNTAGLVKFYLHNLEESN